MCLQALYISKETAMAIGSSGRIVIEVEPELKHLLHAELQKDGLTLKDWFTEQARKYLFDHRQLALDFSESPAPESAPAPRKRAAR
jgi:hypothetical protein